MVIRASERGSANHGQFTSGRSQAFIQTWNAKLDNTLLTDIIKKHLQLPGLTQALRTLLRFNSISGT